LTYCRPPELLKVPQAQENRTTSRRTKMAMKLARAQRSDASCAGSRAANRSTGVPELVL
jgi:hypothetical protein